MNVDEYFSDLSREINSLQRRVRHLMDDVHWLTDGEWKESVVRQILRRHLPATVEVGRGFVITGDRESTQIDVLIRDASKPVLFRDGDLAFVTPDAVLGIIEVKSRLTPGEFREAAVKLGSNIEFIRRHPNTHAFAAIFAFEADGLPDNYLQTLPHSSTNWNQRLDFAAIGNSVFLRYWPQDPLDHRKVHESWHSYNLPDRVAGYFVHNVVDAISPQSVFTNKEVWFPHYGKEVHKAGEIKAPWGEHAVDGAAAD